VVAMLMASISTSARTWNPGGYGRPQPLRGGSSDYGSGAYTRPEYEMSFGESMPEEEIGPFMDGHPDESRILDEIELRAPEPEEQVAATATVQLLPEQLPSCLAAHPCLQATFLRRGLADTAWRERSAERSILELLRWRSPSSVGSTQTCSMRSARIASARCALG